MRRNITLFSNVLPDNFSTHLFVIRVRNLPICFQIDTSFKLQVEIGQIYESVAHELELDFYS